MRGGRARAGCGHWITLSVKLLFLQKKNSISRASFKTANKSTECFPNMFVTKTNGSTTSFILGGHTVDVPDTNIFQFAFWHPTMVFLNNAAYCPFGMIFSSCERNLLWIWLEINWIYREMKQNFSFKCMVFPLKGDTQNLWLGLKNVTSKRATIFVESELIWNFVRIFQNAIFFKISKIPSMW